MQIDGQIAFVTGGGSGLGAATARALAERGARVAVVDRRAVAAQAVADEIEGLGIGADITELAEVERAFQAVVSRWSQAPRIVVSCAGIGSAARILPREGNLSVDVFEKTLRVNLVGTYIVLSVAARAMAELTPLEGDSERGVIINTASVAFEDGQIGQAAYAASKGGIASLTLPAARELARIGVRVAAIAPGLFETPMTAGLPAESREAIIANIPFPKRLGAASEFAALACHIVENAMINGSVLRLDGAVRLPQR
ncbi:MAG: SDR family NAD(P)-dependent oxidoreductase [Devosia sp.]